MEDPSFKKAPPRLPVVIVPYPLYLITFNTLARARTLATQTTQDAFVLHAREGAKRGASVGRYVIMPDHLHFFLRFNADITLGRWVAGLKRRLSDALVKQGINSAQIPGCKLRGHWQPGFFDHLLRTDESYAEKWAYVWKNPVRAGLVRSPEQWPYQGEIVRIDRA